jgi:hypothetical protein
VGNNNYKENEEIINLEYVIFSNNSALSKDSIYIGINLEDYINKTIKMFDVYYYGKYIETIEKNGKIFIKFENEEVDKRMFRLYKLIIDVYKKYGIKNNNWNKEQIGNTNDFLFKIINIPENFIYNVRNKMLNEMSDNNYDIINASKIHEYIEKYKKSNNIELLNVKNNFFIKIYDSNNINNKSRPIITRVTRVKKYNSNNINNNNNNNNVNNINNINNKKFYFANIKYNFSDNEIFDKIIYLGKFIKADNDILFFENIIIKPKSEKLKRFKLYYIIE